MIDAHAHLWDRNRFEYSWLDREPDLPTVFLPGDLGESGSAVLNRYVFVQADCRRDQGVAEAAWVHSLDGRTQHLAGIVAFAPLEDADCEAVLEELQDIPSVVGVRRLLQDEPLEFFTDPGLRRGLDYVANSGWTFDACVRWHQLDTLRQLASEHEDLPIVLDHLGKPPVRDTEAEAFDAWHDVISRLAELPNVSVKLSGLPAELGSGTDDFVYSPWLCAAVELFGPERAMIGSDWPVSAVPGLGRDDWFQVVQKSIDVAGSDWTAVSRTTAERFYGLRSVSSSH